MTWIAKIEGKLTNGFPLEHSIECPTDGEANAAAEMYLDGMGDALVDPKVTIEEKPRFENHLFNDVADILHERLSEGVLDIPTGATIDQEAVDEAIRLHGEGNLWSHVNGMIDDVYAQIDSSGALERAQEKGVQEGRLTAE